MLGEIGLDLGPVNVGNSVDSEEDEREEDGKGSDKEEHLTTPGIKHTFE